MKTLLSLLPASLIEHPKTTVFGLLAASFGALAITPNLDSMTPGQIAFAYGSCLFIAVKSILSADASKTETK